MMDGRMNRAGAKHVGEPPVILGSDRQACMYAAAMVEKGFLAMVPDFEDWEAYFAPPATVRFSHPDDRSAFIEYVIPSRVLAYDPENAVTPMQDKL